MLMTTTSRQLNERARESVPPFLNGQHPVIGTVAMPREQADRVETLTDEPLVAAEMRKIGSSRPPTEQSVNEMSLSVSRSVKSLEKSVFQPPDGIKRQ